MSKGDHILSLRQRHWIAGTLVWLMGFGAMMAAVDLPERKFLFHQFAVADGEPNCFVNDLERDHLGLLWLATYNGLFCFDGAHFMRWSATGNQQDGLRNSIIHSLAEDADGNIWCVIDDGVERFDRRHFQHYPLQNALDGTNITYGLWKVICTRDHQIAAVSRGGIHLYDAANEKFVQVPPVDPSGAPLFTSVVQNTILEDSVRKGIWMGTDKGIMFFDLTTQTYHSPQRNPHRWDVLNGHEVSAMNMDHRGRLIFFDYVLNSIVKWDPRTEQRELVEVKHWSEKPMGFAEIFADRNDNLWISTWDYKLFFVEGATGAAYRIQHDPKDSYSISANFFWDVMEDEDGTLTFGTVNGLSVMNPKQVFFSIHEFPVGSLQRTYYGNSSFLNQDQQGNLWFAPSYEYLLRYDLQKETFERLEMFDADHTGLEHAKYVLEMQPTEDTLYFGTERGIVAMDIATRHFRYLSIFPDSISPKRRHIGGMKITSQGELWFVAIGLGIGRYDLKSHAMRLYRRDAVGPSACPKATMQDFYEGAQGELWISTIEYGPIRYDRAQDRWQIPDAAAMAVKGEGSCAAMVIDKSGSIWLMNVINGLLHYDGRSGVMQRIVLPGRMTHLFYGGMVIDSDDRLWMAYYNDFTVIDPRSGSVENFRVDHSREDTRYWDFLTNLQDGRILSETRNGFILFDPGKRKQLAVNDPITISNFSSGDTAITLLDFDAALDLHYWQNHFSIDFGSLGMMKSPTLQFQYQLQGFDRDWVDCGARRTAYYTNVSGGDYTFKVRCGKPGSQLQEGSAKLRIHIGHIFYRTIWFRLLLIFMLLALLVWWANAWRRRVQRRDYERAISYFANSLYGNNQVSDILWDITDNVITRTNLVDCVIYLVDASGENLVQMAAYGEKRPIPQDSRNPLSIPMGAGIVGAVARAGKAEIIDDTRRDQRYIPSHLKGRSELAVPMIHDGKVLGVIDAEHPRKSYFRKAHLELLSTIANISATKIANAQKVNEIRDKEHRLQELTAQVSETRQLALRAQMNPHFIFNCLNSINSFILNNDSDTASTYLIKFSRLIRLILENSNDKYISLQSELDALRLYIEMENLRFDTKFTWEIAIDDDVATHHILVPPLILQPFVENAIWHGLLHKNGPGLLKIDIVQEAHHLVCAIDDNGVGRAASAALKSSSLVKRQSLGMKLTEERLALMNAQELNKFDLQIIDKMSPSGEPLGTTVRFEMEI